MEVPEIAKGLNMSAEVSLELLVLCMHVLVGGQPAHFLSQVSNTSYVLEKQSCGCGNASPSPASWCPCNAHMLEAYCGPLKSHDVVVVSQGSKQGPTLLGSSW